MNNYKLKLFKYAIVLLVDIILLGSSRKECEI